MRRSSAFALLAIVGLGRPAAATTFDINYTGFAQYMPEGTPYDVVFDETGSGALDLDATLSEVTLDDGLNSFNFTTYLTETVYTGGGTYVFPPQSVTYGLADLAYFDAILSGGVILYFEFATNTKYQYYGDGTSVSFSAFGGYGESYIDGGGPSPSGSIVLTPGTTADVPEAASWALMVSGFGLVGTTLRMGRRVEARRA